ncbi:MAG TPA: hypothetical protein DGG95_14985 [Cytophagales bacterium]|jgi:hypothetical protein|nr:hypothetical protein [Cytophagales bacterium]
MKTIVLVLLIALGFNAMAQSHDEGYRSNDPAKAVSLYPNPASDVLTLKFESPIAKTAKLEFHTIIGTTLELEHEAIDDFEVRVKVKDLSTGYYLISIHDSQSNTKSIQKFLKK